MSEPIDVKSLRESLDWTQERMAEYLGLDRSSVSRIEGGQPIKGPTRKLLEQLAQTRAESSGGRTEILDADRDGALPRTAA